MDSGRVPDAVFTSQLDQLVRRGVLRSWRRHATRTGYRTYRLTFPDGEVLVGSTGKTYGVILGATYALGLAR